MKIKPRHMKKYTPRRRRSSKDLQKQQLKDFEHLLNMDLSSYLILIEEGTKRQIDQAKAKMLSDLKKYGSDMEAIGRDIGEGLPEMIRNYIKTMMQIAQNTDNAIDPAMINEARKQALNLSKKAA